MPDPLKSDDLTKLTIDRSPDGVVILDLDGGLRYANPAACTLTGYTVEELLRAPRGTVIVDRTGEGIVEDLRGLREIKSQLREAQLRTKEGRIIPVELHSAYLQLDDREYICSYVRDVSEWKRVNLELQEALARIEALNQKLNAENIYLRDEIHDVHNYAEIISENPAIEKIVSQIEHVAKSDATVFLLGESGTGKELFARLTHSLSDRASKPLIKVNCTALSPNLVESDLFGHEKGAFTGAHARKLGRFELADQGTLFLDEIGDFPLDLQPKLLRALQEGEFERLGGVKTIKVDVRIVAATNRNMQVALQEKTFREDLFYRLSVFPLKIPPLRERKEDIPALANYFLKRHSRKLGKNITEISPVFLQKLIDYSWPGNIRELENVIERAVILCAEASLDMKEPLNLFADSEVCLDAIPKTLRESEQSLIERSLRECNWVIEGSRGAAASLGIPPSTLRERIKKYEIKRPE